jgi:8-oxo-dGTP pyrophosphatase MutT (NUDIX family)
VRETREETGLDARIVTGPGFRHRAVTTHRAPFTIIEMNVTDPIHGPHRHIDFLYLYELFRLSIRPLLRRDSLGHGRAVAVQGCP